MDDFHPNQIKQLAFDLDSLGTELSGDRLLNFREILRTLDERGFHLLLLSEQPDLTSWGELDHLSVVKGSPQEVVSQNPQLQRPDTFWISHAPLALEWLADQQLPFGGGEEVVRAHGGLQYQYLNDLLEIFHPSRNTALDLAIRLRDLKDASPRMPLTLGIGGPEDCGHAFFVGELVEALEEFGLLVAGLDLTELLGLEFANTGYWRSPEARSWVLDGILHPFSRGEVVVQEKSPSFLEAWEITPFPFYAPPEGLLLIWGSTLFLPDFENLFDLRLHLDVSPKEAASRLFEIDSRERFDDSFVESYLQREGHLYQSYLEEHQAEARFDFRINFDNYNAFRLKA